MHEPRGGCEQGGIVMDGLHIHNDRPRPWLTTYVDPSTRLESIAGTVTVTTKPEFAAKACGVEAGKPSDVADLGAVSVACDTAGTAHRLKHTDDTGPTGRSLHGAG